MASFNKVLLMGNLTRDPQMKYLPSQTPVVEFGIAVNRRYKTQAGEEREETAFVDCTAFGKQAEVIHQWCAKGKPLFIEGRLKYDTWDDKNGGGKRSKLSVVVETFQFVGSTASASSGQAGSPQVGGRDGVEHGNGGAPNRDRAPERRPGTEEQLTLDNERQPKESKSPVSDRPVFADADIPF